MEWYSLGTAWVQLGSNINGDANGDQLGGDVNISNDGNTIVVGAEFSDINGNGSGKVSVFEYDGNDWIAKGNDIPGLQTNGNFGISVDISADGNTIIGGEAYYRNGQGQEVGRTRVFSWSGSAWVQKGQSIDGVGNNDRSGQRVSISPNGNQIAIRSLLSASGTSNLIGKTKTYNFDGTNWVQYGGTIEGQAAGDNSGFGLAFSADGETIVIGSFFSDGNGQDSGQARVFRLDASLSVEEQILLETKLYPNPVSNSFSIELPVNSEKVNIQVISILGEVVLNENYSNVRVINRNFDFPVGNYIVKLKVNNKHTKIFKMIKW